jgi:signal transduction histidine kinase
VRDHAARVRSRDGLDVTVDAPANLPDLPDLPDLPVELEEDLYRIVQEALHNTVKHAQARTACVRFTLLGPGRDDLVVEISDDGRGADQPNPAASTLGLASMRERVRRWGGSLTASAAADHGYLVRVIIGDLTLLIARSAPVEEGGLS